MPSYVTSMDNKINKINNAILSDLGKRTIIESSHGFILIKDDDNHVTVIVDEENITANIIRLNYMLKIVRDQDDMLMYAYEYIRFVYYNGIVYGYKGSVSMYEGFFVDSRLSGQHVIDARTYYKRQLTDTLRFCQNMITTMIDRITTPLNILACIDYITALSLVPV